MRVAILIFSFLLGAGFQAQAQTESQNNLRRGYEIGPGDKISGKVLGESDFNFDSVVDEDGKIQVPFSPEGIVASCKTERELREVVVEQLKRYLRNPQVSVNVVERNRPPVTIYGEITSPQKITLTRPATLLEIISFSGGVTRSSNGVIEITRTADTTCSRNPEDRWDGAQNVQSGFPTKSFLFSALKDTNPSVFPGDVILVQKFPPVYVVGEVLKPGEISIPEEGLPLMQALAMASGVSRTAKIKDIRIYRKKEGQTQPEVISVDISKVRTGDKEDLMLQPFDIVDVGAKPQSVGSILLDIATGSARNTANVLPMRVF
jgi:polysaccharide export outer membrane protein